MEYTLRKAEPKDVPDILRLVKVGWRPAILLKTVRIRPDSGRITVQTGSYGIQQFAGNVQTLSHGGKIRQGDNFRADVRKPGQREPLCVYWQPAPTSGSPYMVRLSERKFLQLPDQTEITQAFS